MVNKVFVGGISPEGEHLLTTYINAFVPDAQLEPLRPAGIKGKIKNQASKADVLMVIIDDSLYQQCEGVADDVLKLPKVHRYVDDDGLQQFLIQKFGRLDGIDETDTVIPPDVLMQQQEEPETAEEDNDYIPQNTEMFEKAPTSETIPPDKLVSEDSGIVNTVVDEDEDFSISEEDFASAEKAANESSNDAVVAELRDKLARSEMLVHNLTLQLDDKASMTDEDTKALISRIKELEQAVEERDTQLSQTSEDNYVALGKVARAEQVINQFDDLKAKLKQANNDKSALEYDKTNLSGQVELLGRQIDELKIQVAEIDVLKKDIADKNDEITRISDDLAIKSGELDEKSTEVERLNGEIGVLQNQIASDKEKLADLETKSQELSTKRLELDNLNVDLRTKQEELDKANGEIAQLKSEIETLKNDLAEKAKSLEEKDKEINDALELTETSDSKITELQNQINTLTQQLSEQSSTISAKDSEIEDYKSKISEYQGVSEKLSTKEAENTAYLTEIASLKESVTNLNTEILQLKSDIEAKSLEITKLETENGSIKDSSDIQSQAIDKALSEKQSLEDRLVEAEEAKLNLENKVSALEKDAAELKTAKEASDNKVTELQANNEKLTNQIDQLQNDLIKAKADDENVTRLETELLEERRKSARLTSEVEVLKKTDDSGKTSELRIEIAKLRNELAQTKEANTDASTEEISQLKNDLQESRERCASLELDILAKDDQIKDMSEGVFAQMANVAMPKAVCDIALPKITGTSDKLRCIAGGSLESSIAVYQTLRRACTIDSSRRTLIVDLVTDSCIDREFGCKCINTFRDWLTGSASITNFIADTKYPNVKVVSTSLAYINDLFFLLVNWQKRINELSAFNADLVIINVGCLNNIVSKILFNAFSHVMKSYIIVKATPVNLRTVILNLTSFKEVSPNVVVECVDFDANSSTHMYQRLVTKYKAQILKQSDTLKF